jgi:hypothetical protein
MNQQFVTPDRVTQLQEWILNKKEEFDVAHSIALTPYTVKQDTSVRVKRRTAMVMYYQEVDEYHREAVQMGEKWMVNTIKVLWEHSCSLWMSRNEFIHGKDEAMKHAKLKKQLEAAVDKAFKHDKDDVPANFRSLFAVGADNVKQQ